jgi:cytoskeletal protein CcmA (bactofilin family)
VEVAGAISVDGAAELNGRCEIGEGLSAGSLRFTGELQLPDAVRVVGDIHGSLSGRSRAASLRAGSVEIVRARPHLPPWGPPGTLEVLRIEANEVRLEGVVAEFVKSDRIYLGRDCRISRVEGQIVERHRSAQVGPSRVSDVLVHLTR